MERGILAAARSSWAALFAGWLLGWLLVPADAVASDALCAKVKLEIGQELTLERQAFDAHMRITNGTTHLALEDVGVTVTFTDEAGNPVLATSDPNDTSASFFLRVDTLNQISAVDGTGSVAPSTSADVHWLIIPAPGAAKGAPQGTLYRVGATLTYRLGGKPELTVVSPDWIYVKPMPELALDYFLPGDVYGDDAFTPEIESPIPFGLGVRVTNRGQGFARRVRIESSQPKITDNEQGLMVGFRIEASEVNGSPTPKSLLASFGDIGPQMGGIARWIMTTPLSGRFTELAASYTHSDELGGAVTSLLTDPVTHLLLRDVLVDLPGRDGVRDFLARDGDALKVYESEAIDSAVAELSAQASLAGSGQNGSEARYELAAPLSGGFSYVRLTDPHGGQKVLKSVVRSDGKRVGPDNAWLSKSRNKDRASPDYLKWEHFVHLFDADSTGSYTVVFDAPAAQPNPPVLQFIADRTVAEGSPVSFLVEASDADGTPPSLSASSLPAGARFADGRNGSGTFAWTPAAGQAGKYPITFKASDGALEAKRTATITVNPLWDSDGDGMVDAWELAHFGTLARDGTGDFDGDGVSDLQEHLARTDPASDFAPTVPVVQAPAPGSEVPTRTPTLVVSNSFDREGDPVTCEFELFADGDLRVPIAAASAPAGPGSTAWAVPLELSDNTRHLWRVRATDGQRASQWAYGGFFVNTANDAPGAFAPSSPAEGTLVDAATPRLQVSNARDADEDAVLYAFEVFADAGLTDRVAEVSGIPAGTGGATSWTVDALLLDGRTYYWRAVAVDEHGAATESAGASFTVDLSKRAPAPPVVSAPADGAEAGATAVSLAVENALGAEGRVLTYAFEIDAVETFDSPARQTVAGIAEGQGLTSWAPSAELRDNTRYHWRVKASDGRSESGWSAVARLFVNTRNDPPAAPVLRNPSAGGEVQVLRPTLSVAPAEDPDGDSLTYEFEVYRDAALSDRVARAEGQETLWSLSQDLADDGLYHWRARAVDEHGESGPWMPAAAFFVNTRAYDEPPTLVLTSPTEAGVLTNQTSFTLEWTDSDPDSSARVSLYYETDGAGHAGVRIVGDLPEDDPGNRYVWDTSGLPDGTYQVYGVIEDGVHTAASYAPGPLVIDRTPPAVVLFSPAAGLTADATPPLAYTASDGTVTVTVDGVAVSRTSGQDLGPLADGPHTVRVEAVDAAGNLGFAEVAFTVQTVVPDLVSVQVGTSKGRSLAGLKVYAFTSGGVYTGKSATSDASGVAGFPTAGFAAGAYKFRADYLGSQFWSSPISLPGAYSASVTLAEETATVSVLQGGEARAGVRVYLFSASGTYLGQSATTDALGRVSFELPAGKEFKFRADILGNQYWSGPTAVGSGSGNLSSVDSGGGRLSVTVDQGGGAPLVGTSCYLFSAAGTYLGLTAKTDAQGKVFFDLPSAGYKVRCDHLGYSFWTEAASVLSGATVTLSIPHREAVFTVQGQCGDSLEPKGGTACYLFTESGSYLGQTKTTDAAGRVTFRLPEKSYKVRADYRSFQYWSAPTTGEGREIRIPEGWAEVTVTQGEVPAAGAPVHVFNAAGSYLGLSQATDAHGKAAFRLPAQAFRFRADVQGNPYFQNTTLSADETTLVLVSTGGGPFSLSVEAGPGEPLEGLQTHLFSEAGSYLGVSHPTDETGTALFVLSEGTFRFRVDDLGGSFWTGPVVLPGAAGLTFRIPRQTASIRVLQGGTPQAGIRVFLFDDEGAYLGLSALTDGDGQAAFTLPVGQSYLFRADLLGNSYWSDPVTLLGVGTAEAAVETGGGLLTVRVAEGEGTPIPGAGLYLFDPTGTYLGRSGTTDGAGLATFDVPSGTYKVRCDLLGGAFWSDEVAVTADARLDFTVPHRDVTVTVTGEFDGSAEPRAGVPVYLFHESGSYLGRSTRTDESGKARFDVPERSYKIRADVLSTQFWSDPFVWQDPVISIPDAVARVRVTRGASGLADVPVYVFNEEGTYLGVSSRTDAEGALRLRLPAGTYDFRAEVCGNRYWSGPLPLAADEENPVEVATGGGRFTLRVEDGSGQVLESAAVYLFSSAGAYLGASGRTSSAGEAAFDLSDGLFQFRVDWKGHSFWTDPVAVPEFLDSIFPIPHRPAAATVLRDQTGTPVPAVDVPVYLFTPSGSYLGESRRTDADGRVSFLLPERAYKLRADFLAGRYWSAPFEGTEAAITIREGRAEVTVAAAEGPVANAPVYVYGANGTYLGLTARTEGDGKVGFWLPEGDYRFRADVGPNQHFADATVFAGQAIPVSIDTE